MSIRTMLWDADGVLQQVPDGGEESLRSALRDHVEDPGALERFFVEAKQAERPALAGHARWLDVLPGLLARHGLEDVRDDLVRSWLSIEPVEPARGLVRTLRTAGVACWLASNQDEHRARFMHENLGYADLMDGELYSCELGVAKPEPGYFRTILARLRVPGAEVMFVDDNRENVEAAREVGLAAEQWSSREPVDLLRAHLVRHGLPV